MGKIKIFFTLLLTFMILSGCGNDKGDVKSAIALEDGVYTADFTTDSTMFHVNETNNGKGILTVENGQATIHVSLASKGILNLYCGLAEDAAKAGSVLLNPTVDTVRYNDGMTQEVYGYDIPVPAIDEEFDVAIIGSKGKWYDHKVKVSNPVKTDDTGALNLKTGTYEVQVELTGGSGKASINSPAVLNVGETDAVVRLEWSSPNYDYMIVDGQKYLNVNEEGNSVFEIPVSALDEQINVIANTTAMGKPHEIEYVITLHLTGNDNSTSQNTSEDNSKVAGKDTIFEIPEKIGNDLSLSHSLELKYATKFSVDYFVSDADKSQYTLLSVNDDGQYLLVPSDKMDSDLAGLNESASKLGIKLIKQPSDIYLASSQSMDFFVSLGELDRIKFSALAENDWYIDAAKAKMQDGSISYAGKYSAPDYEMLLSSKCDFVIENTMIYHSPEVKEKLENLGFNVMVDGSSYESHPLGRCEWVKLYGALLSCEDKAQKAFDEQVKKFEEIKTAAVNSEKPTIAFFYIASNGTVKVRNNDDYFTKMIELAGGRSAFYDILKDNESSSATVSLSMESFYEAAKDADYIIYNSTVDGEIKSVNDLLNKSELFANFKAFKEDNVYCITKDLFQSAMEIGDIIQDLNKMLVQDENMSFIYKVK